MRLQETFDELLIHLRALGGEKSMGTVGGNLVPVYKTDDGEAGCPVGRLLSKEKYGAWLENQCCDSGPVRVILTEAGYNVALCRMFQVIHDGFKPERWEDCVSILAKTVGLKYIAPIGHVHVEGIDVLTNGHPFMPYGHLKDLIDDVAIEKYVDKMELDLHEVASKAVELAS